MGHVGKPKVLSLSIQSLMKESGTQWYCPKPSSTPGKDPVGCVLPLCLELHVEKSGTKSGFADGKAAPLGRGIGVPERGERF